MLVSPARNHSSSCTMALSGSFLVVTIGKPGRQIEAHLVAEHRQRAGAGAIVLFGAVAENSLEQIVILVHGSFCGLLAAGAGEPIFRTGGSTVPIRPTADYTRKNRFRLAKGKGSPCTPVAENADR